jgi:hypothetical protein
MQISVPNVYLINDHLESLVRNAIVTIRSAAVLASHAYHEFAVRAFCGEITQSFLFHIFFANWTVDIMPTPLLFTALLHLSSFTS